MTHEPDQTRIRMTNTASHPNKTFPPGPPTPLFGLLLAQELVANALGAVQRLQREHGDVLYFRILQESFYYLFSPEQIRTAIVERADDHIRHERAIDVFTQIYGANVLTTEGEAWKRQRRILMPGFLPKKVAGYLGLMTAATNDNLASWFTQGKGESITIDVGNFTRKVTVDVILRVLFSHQTSETDSFRALEATLTLEHQSMRELYWPKTPPDWMPYPGRTAKLRAKDVLQKLISDRIAVRRAGRASRSEGDDNTDYLAMLLSAQDDEAQNKSAATLSNDEIRDNCMVIFAAGHDTTATALTWWIALMAQHSEYASKVRQEIAEVLGERMPAAEDFAKLNWLNATLKEALRLYPPAPLLFVRRVTQDITLGEWTIPKGSNLSVPVWHVHHDARWFPEPDTFQPERFLPGAPDIPRGAYLPFGTGPRVCIGQHFAMMEMALIAALLIRAFDFTPTDDAGMPKPKIAMVLQPERALRINFTRR
ncbi:MAG: cytochrome P450 [Proteobacteria bacterium]|nr:cytochrome P450 [Pseudomonadota bacterium]